MPSPDKPSARTRAINSVRDLGFARIDKDRTARTGAPEAIYAEGKSPAQVLTLANAHEDNDGPLIITRLGTSHMEALRSARSDLILHAEARLATIGKEKSSGRNAGLIAAGTSDRSVAEEAAITLETLGHGVNRFYDVGVAGLQRVLDPLPQILENDVLIVVAGMEGALPSVLGGLTDLPAIAVPTSVGYGASFAGVAALLGMLNSCAPGLSVVNIDNGFGAALAAHRILRRLNRS